MLVAVVGNKCDLTDEIVISSDQAEAFATDFNAVYMKTSAKENLGVHELFDQICDKLIDKLDIQASKDDRKRLNSSNKGEGKKSCCG